MSLLCSACRNSPFSFFSFLFLSLSFPNSLLFSPNSRLSTLPNNTHTSIPQTSCASEPPAAYTSSRGYWEDSYRVRSDGRRSGRRYSGWIRRSTLVLMFWFGLIWLGWLVSYDGGGKNVVCYVYARTEPFLSERGKEVCLLCFFGGRIN